MASFGIVVFPGGFSYGDHLRCGAVARFSPVMASVVDFARRGGFVIGICNGFQVLCESHLLPGALMRNDSLQFRCNGDTLLRVENANTAFTSQMSAGQLINIPISHGEGNYFADADTLRRLEETGRVAFRYCDATGAVTPEANPNGSLHNIAGILNEAGNVLGMMPHPERSVEDVLGGEDGLMIFRSIARNAERVLAG